MKEEGRDGEDLVRVRVTWTETVTMDGVRDLDAARMRRLGYDPSDTGSIERYLNAADDLEDDDWYPWHSEFADVGRRIDADNAAIESVEIEA